MRLRPAEWWGVARHRAGSVLVTAGASCREQFAGDHLRAGVARVAMEPSER